MSEHVAKIVEVVGTSDESIEKAIETAIARTAKTVRNMRWFQVTETRGHIADGKVERYQVMLKIGFALDD
jgi:flavin-binding protein dodecin